MNVEELIHALELFPPETRVEFAHINEKTSEVEFTSAVKDVNLQPEYPGAARSIVVIS